MKSYRKGVQLIGYRYNGDIQISYETNKGIENELILKNILQLLVENALFHGLMNEDDSLSGNIAVMVYPSGDEIVIEVSDDGKGIAKERLELLKNNKFDVNIKNKDRNHIGLKNIYERLTYIFKEDFRMEIFSEEGEGTTIIISAPLYSKIMVNPNELI